MTATLFFVSGYLINMTYISVFYHRSFAHNALTLKPWLRTFVLRTGPWIVGVDPIAWVTMHRLHHRHSDTVLDPHSPSVRGVLSVFWSQLRSYQSILILLTRPKAHPYKEVAADLECSTHPIYRRRLWYLPYVLHILVAALLVTFYGSVAVGVAYWLGMMSHPVQGWLVNAFGHSAGYRTFPTTDQSTNNTPVALLAFGEGYQNNHHQFPHRANFAIKSGEFDFGYLICLLLARLGLARIHEDSKDFATNLILTREV